jgi:hypothetical protein
MVKSAYPADRLDAIRWAGQARLVECPRCGACVGEDCHSESWYRATPHAGRVRAAEEAQA